MPSIRLLEHRPGNTRGGFFVGMGRQPVRYGLPRSNYSPWAPRPVACFRSAYGIRRDAPAACSVWLLSLPIHSARYRSCGEPGALFVGMGRQPMHYELPRSNFSLSGCPDGQCEPVWPAIDQHPWPLPVRWLWCSNYSLSIRCRAQQTFSRGEGGRASARSEEERRNLKCQ